MDLPKHIKHLADRKFELFKEDHSHPSLEFSKKGAVWTVIIGYHYRAIAFREGEDIVWFWIGSHEKCQILSPSDLFPAGCNKWMSGGNTLNPPYDWIQKIAKFSVFRPLDGKSRWPRETSAFPLDFLIMDVLILYSWCGFWE